MKKSIVFGGSGFLGSHIAEILSNNGHEVTIFDLNKSKYSFKNQKMIIGDILDSNKIKNVIKGKDYVFNFAGISDIDYSNVHPIDTMKQNIIGNSNIVNGCYVNNIKRFIFASSIYVYSDKGGFYRVSKQACENFIESFSQEKKLDYTILRFGSLYGPRSNNNNGIFRFINEAINKKSISFNGSPNSYREFIHVNDAAKMTLKILSKEYKNQHVTLTGQQKLKIKDLLTMIKEILSIRNLKIKYSKNKNLHYEMTPYKFNPKYGKNITLNEYIDIGQGLLELIEILNDNSKKK
tara:strand:- start:9281 stop:10159 length:879 start_codon:yes stop_codon:yes gene_type:complete